MGPKQIKIGNAFRHLIALILILILGCTARSSTSLDRDLEAILACETPCWNRIVPGQTSAENALSILTLLEAEGEGRLERLPGWLARFSAGGIAYYFRASGETVESINFRVHYTSLESLIEDFGEPDRFALLEIDEGGFSVAIYYPQEGLAFFVGGRATSDGEFHFYPEMPVTLAFLMAPTDLVEMIEIAHGAVWVDSILQTSLPWSGFGPIPDPSSR